MQSFGVVITGGAGGVGFAYADEFVRLGHKVVICDVKDPEAAVQASRFTFQPMVCVPAAASNATVRA